MYEIEIETETDQRAMIMNEVGMIITLRNGTQSGRMVS